MKGTDKRRWNIKPVSGFGSAVMGWSALALITASFVYGPYHADELHQTWAFALFKLGLHDASELPWEFRDQIRPWLQPGMYVLLFGPAAEIVGFHQMWFSRFAQLFHWALATLALWELRAFAPLYRVTPGSTAQRRRDWMLAALLATWFVPNLMVRTSSEATTTVCIMFSLAWLQRGLFRRRGAWWVFAAGLMAGLAFWFRFQSAIFYVGFFPACFALLRSNKARLRMATAGGGLLLAMLIGVLVDRWGYGEWVLSPWRYFSENILHDRASSFGTNPWYYYLLIIPGFALNPLLWLWIGVGTSKLWRAAPQASKQGDHEPQSQHAVLLAGAAGAVLFLLIHSLIAHKEPRFVMPLVAPFGLLALAATREEDAARSPVWRMVISVHYAKLLVLLNLVTFVGFLWTCSVRPRRGADAFFWDEPRPAQVITSLPNFGAFDTNLGMTHSPPPDFQAGFAIPKGTHLIGAPADRYTEACIQFPNAVVLFSSHDAPAAKLDRLHGFPEEKLLYRFPRFESPVPGLPTKPWRFKGIRCADLPR